MILMIFAGALFQKILTESIVSENCLVFLGKFVFFIFTNKVQVTVLIFWEI